MEEIESDGERRGRWNDWQREGRVIFRVAMEAERQREKEARKDGL